MNETLKNHLETVKENSKTVRNIYLSFLGFATYIWLTAESVTHLQLLIPTEGLSLPIVGIKLGVVGFFWVAPILLFLFHIYFALHVWQLAELLHKVRMETQGKVKDLQDQISGSMFVWVFLESHRKGGLVSMLMNVFVFFSFWCVVPIVLLRCQWQFLPYHHETINHLLQGLLILSLVLSSFFYIKVASLKPRKLILHCFTEDGKFENYWTAFKTDCLKSAYFLFRYGSLGFFALFVVLMPVFSTTVLVIPQNKEENQACFEGMQKPFEWIAVALKSKAKKSKCKNGQGLKIRDVIDRNLNLPEKKLALKPSDILIAAYKEKPEEILDNYGTLDLKDRHLQFANFSKADLRKADLRSARLQGAYLYQALIQGVNLEDAHLQGAYLRGAQLQGANLFKAQLQGVDLREAHLQSAFFREAQVQGADLREAKLQGADFQQAKLQGVNLRSAQLQGTSWFFTELQGADLKSAQLQGAVILNSKLNGVNFSNVNLGPWKLKKRELDNLIKYAPQDHEVRIRFKKRLRMSLGKRANIISLGSNKIRHSYPFIDNKMNFQFLEKASPFPRPPLVFLNVAINQIQFKNIPSQTKLDNLALRKQIYLPLLCEHPILIKRTLDEQILNKILEKLGDSSTKIRNEDPGLFLFNLFILSIKESSDELINNLSLDEVFQYASKHCPQYLPEKYRKLNVSVPQASTSTSPR